MSVHQSHPEFFMFVDEMGSDRRDCMRKLAYNLKGRPPVVENVLFRGEHVSAITAMMCDRILDFHTFIGSVTADGASIVPWKGVKVSTTTLFLWQWSHLGFWP